MASAKEIADKTGAKVTPVVADHSKPEGRQALLTACPEMTGIIRLILV